MIGAIRADCVNEMKELGRVIGVLNLRTPHWVAANSSEGLRNARALGVPDRRLALLPNVVDCLEFTAGPRSARDAGSSGDPIRLVTAGRLVDQKRFDRFVTLIARLRSRVGRAVKGVIVGDGHLRQALQEQIRRLGLTERDIELRSATQRMTDLYKETDIFVLTSDFEGTPNVLLEAMASGVATISTDVGDVAELIQHGVSGFLAQRDDADGLLACAATLVEDRARRESFGMNGRRQIEARFSLGTLHESLDRLYRTVEARRPVVRTLTAGTMTEG